MTGSKLPLITSLPIKFCKSVGSSFCVVPCRGHYTSDPLQQGRRQSRWHGVRSRLLRRRATAGLASAAWSRLAHYFFAGMSLPPGMRRPAPRQQGPTSVHLPRQHSSAGSGVSAVSSCSHSLHRMAFLPIAVRDVLPPGKRWVWPKWISTTEANALASTVRTPTGLRTAHPPPRAWSKAGGAAVLSGWSSGSGWLLVSLARRSRRFRQPYSATSSSTCQPGEPRSERPPTAVHASRRPGTPLRPCV